MTDLERLPVDDEALSALIDRALPDDEAERLRRRLAGDRALARRLQALERANKAVRGAYAHVIAEPMPATTLELLESRDDVAGEPCDKVARRPIAARRGPWIPYAVAAGVAAAALAVGFWLGAGARTGAPAGLDLLAGRGVVAENTGLYRVLQSQPSGATLAISSVLAATPRLTFRTVDGAYCRQVDLAGERGRTRALACGRGGAWRLELAAFGPASPDADVYRPAAGTTELDDVIGALIDGAPLDRERERVLIESGWAGP